MKWKMESSKRKDNGERKKRKTWKKGKEKR